ncbi:MAG: energy-coupling factor transporter transmembrane component T [Thermoproteota archaeon]
MPWVSMYIPKDTLVHKTHAKVKLAWTIVLSLIAVMFYNPIPAFIIFLLSIPFIVIGKVTITFLKRLFYVSTTLGVIVVFQSLFAKYAKNVLTTIDFFGWKLTILYEGLFKALWLISILLAVIGWFSFLFLTTHPSDLLSALRDIGLPYLACFIVLSTLQMIPMMERNMNLCIESQRSRGLEIGKNPFKLIPIIIPLTVNTLERVTKMSWSLEGRAFGASGKRTNVRATNVTTFGKISIALAIVVLISSIICRVLYGDMYISYEQFLIMLER